MIELEKKEMKSSSGGGGGVDTTTRGEKCRVGWMKEALSRIFSLPGHKRYDTLHCMEPTDGWYGQPADMDHIYPFSRKHKRLVTRSAAAGPYGQFIQFEPCRARTNSIQFK